MEVKKKSKKVRKSHRGGARTGSGRKKVDDPKVGLTIYIAQSEVDLLGGKESARSLAVEALRTKAMMKKVEEM